MNNAQDYSKVLYVEPNYNTNAEEKINTPYYVHDMEDYCIYVDLEVEIFDRNIEGLNGSHTLLFSWKTNKDGNETASFLSGSKIRYGGKDGDKGFQVLTTNFLNTHYDDVVEANTEKQSQNPELFGIKSIDIDYNNYAVPQVQIVFTDVRGASLFGPEEHRHHKTQNGIGGFADDDIAGSFFKCFFTFPYPKFTLMVKGFYGQGVSYQLTCSKFTTKFDSKNGNFDATAEFVGYSYSLLNDITLNAVLAAPLSDYVGMKYWLDRGGSLSSEEVGEDNIEASDNQSDAFTIIDANGEKIKMPTLNRILSLMDDLVSAKQADMENNRDVYQAANNNTELLHQLNNIMQVYDGLCAAIMESLKDNHLVYTESITSDNSSCEAVGGHIVGIVAFTKSDNTNPMDVVNVNFAPYNHQIESYSNGLPSNVPRLKDAKVWTEVLDNTPRIKNDAPLKNFKDIKLQIGKAIADFPNKFKDLNGNVYQNAYVFDGTYFCQQMNKIMQSLTNDKISAELAISELDSKIMQSVLGFTPTVSNIMAIILAHLETLLHIIYTATEEVDNINNTPEYRKLSEFGISTAELTGLDIGADEKVPAWPRIVTKEPITNKWYNGWIGDFPHNGNIQPEANAVNGLLNGIRYIQASIDNAAQALNTNEGTNVVTYCKSRVAYPLVPSDIVEEENPFGYSFFNTDYTVEDAVSNMEANMFVRMCNLFLIDNVRPYNGKLQSTNINDDLVTQMGRIDAVNFYNIYNQKITNDFKNHIISVDFNADRFFDDFKKPNYYWSDFNSESRYTLCDIRNPQAPMSVFNVWFGNENINKNLVRGGVSMSSMLTYGRGGKTENYYYDSENDEGDDKVIYIKENIRYLDNLDSCFNVSALNLEHGNDDTSTYTDLFNEMFDENCHYDGSRIYGEQFSYSNSNDRHATYERNFCYKWTVSDETIKLLPHKNNGIIPLAPRSKTEAESDSVIPVRGGWFTSDIDNDEREVQVIEDGKEKTISIERKKADNDDLEKLVNCENIENTDVTEEFGFIVPTVQYYNEGDWYSVVGTIPSTGVTLFSSPIYYACSNPIGRAMLFLDNMRMHDVNKFIDVLTSDSKDGSSAFVYTTKVNALLLGAYLYYKEHTDMFDSIKYYQEEGIGNHIVWTDLERELHNEYDKLINEGDTSKRLHNCGDLNSKIDKLHEGTKARFVKYFLDWVESDFPKYQNAFELKSKSTNSSLTAKECKQFLEYAKNGNEWQLNSLVESNFNSNYVSINTEGGIFFREDTEIVKKLTNFTVQPILIIKNYFNSTNVEMNRFDNVAETMTAGDFSCYVRGFVAKMKDLVQNDLVDERTFTPISAVKEPDTTKDIQIALYKYLKILHDKWLGATSFDTWKMEHFFKEHFAFIDSYYYDIGDKVIVNPIDMCKLICRSEAQRSFSLISFITTMLQENNLAFMCVQNFLKLKTTDYDNSGKMYVDAMQDMFKPVAFLDMKKFEENPYFVTIYKSEPSTSLNIKGSMYVDDSFMLNYGDSSLWPEAIHSKSNENGYPIPAFGVTYGSQYQSYFTDVNVGMDSAMVTEQSLQAQYIIASMNSKTGGERVNDKENGTSVFAVGQDLYTIYANNSYTCTVTMMGCAWVQPLMYFVLLNIPMFRGSYLIEKVKHSITPGNMVTTFTGVRMANTLTPFVKSPFYLKGDTLDGTYAEQYYKEARCASIDNNCKYACYPIGLTASNGGFEESILVEPKGFQKHGAAENDNFKTRYDTLLEALTCTVIAECGTSDQLAIELVATVLFNRVKNKGDFHIFVPKQIAYDKYDSRNHPSEYDKVLPIVKNIFVNTPIVIVGKTTNVINSVTIYENNEKTEAKTSPVTITKEMVQKMYMYCSRQGYDESNPNTGEDYHPNPRLEKTPSMWRKQKYLCHHDHSNVYGHVFTSGDGNKTYWEYDGNARKNINDAEDNGISVLGNRLITALNQTIQATDRLTCVASGVSLENTDPNLFLIKCDIVEQGASVFDILLNTYSNYISGIGWVCGNSNNISSNKYPDSILVRVTDGTAVARDVAIYVYHISSLRRIRSIGSFVNEAFFKSLSKMYPVASVNGLNNLKRDCKQLAGLSDDEIRQLFANVDVTPCTSVMPKPSQGIKSKSFTPSSPRIGHSWEEVIHGGLVECGCNKSKEEQNAIIADLFGGSFPSSPSEMKQYLAEFEVPCKGSVKKVWLHKKLGPDIVKAFTELRDNGFAVSDVGSYCWRKINNPRLRGSDAMSKHSYGIAIDINPLKNPFFRSAESYSGVDDDANGVIRTVNSRAVKILKKYGWGWGGKYGDTMHFSYLNGS